MKLPRQIERYFEAECAYRDFCEECRGSPISHSEADRWTELRDEADKASQLALAFYEGMRAAREQARPAEEVEDVR